VRSSRVRTYIASRVARWYIFKPKIQIWVNFGMPLNGKCWYLLWPFGLFYGPYIGRYILWPYGNFIYFSSLWYIVSRKIWQPWLQALQPISSTTFNRMNRQHCLSVFADVGWVIAAVERNLFGFRMRIQVSCFAGHSHVSATLGFDQGDQIGRIFSQYFRPLGDFFYFE
jgi:hypothetical protein